MIDLEKLAQEVGALATKAGIYIRNERLSFDPNRIEHKGLNDLVSYVDKEAEQMIVAGLRKLLPDAGFVTEEGTVSKSDGLTDPGPGTYWIIDPLDGTTNFIHGLPIYAVSIGLSIAGTLALGCVYEPNHAELFLAWQDGGAWLNGKRIHVQPTPSLAGGLLATGFPYSKFDKQAAYLATIDEMMRSSHGLRRMGSAAVDLAYTACGRFEGFFEYNLKAWDVAGGIVLVREAGGKVTDFAGGDNCLYGGQLIAAGPSHASMQALIAANFGE